MLSTAIWQPFIGMWIDNATADGKLAGLTGAPLELAAGQETLLKIAIFPAILIVMFIIFYFWQRKTNQAKKLAVDLS